MNHSVIGKLVIFFSAVIVLINEFLYLHYLIIDMFSQILAGPDICLLGDIIVNNMHLIAMSKSN